MIFKPPPKGKIGRTFNVPERVIYDNKAQCLVLQCQRFLIIYFILKIGHLLTVI